MISKYGLLIFSFFIFKKVVIKVAPTNCFKLSFTKRIVKRVFPLRTKKMSRTLNVCRNYLWHESSWLRLLNVWNIVLKSINFSYDL